MAFAGYFSILSLVLLPLVDYSCEQSTTFYPTYTFCSSYCDTKGYWQSGPTCFEKYCCGNSTYRYCCGNISLDVSDKYDDVSSCSCPKNSCYSTPAWEYFVYFFAPLVLFITIALCCCRCCCNRTCNCKKRGDNAATNNRIAAVSSRQSVATLPSAVERSVNLDLHYILEPPSYETVAGDLPKYEDVVNETRGYEGPLESVESTEDLSAPSGEQMVIGTSPSEWSNNDALPQSHVPTTSVTQL